jgi:hypothetical protein
VVSHCVFALILLLFTQQFINATSLQWEESLVAIAAALGSIALLALTLQELLHARIQTWLYTIVAFSELICSIGLVALILMYTLFPAYWGFGILAAVFAAWFLLTAASDLLNVHVRITSSRDPKQ